MSGLEAVVEIPALSRIKYEFDQKTGELLVDRIVTISYPYNYGFVDLTLSEDGDPLDIFIFDCPAVVPGTKLEVVPLGVFMTKDNGKNDPKIVAVPAFVDSVTDSMVDIACKRINEFLNKYKKGVEVLAYTTNLGTVNDVIDASRKRFLASDSMQVKPVKEFH